MSIEINQVVLLRDTPVQMFAQVEEIIPPKHEGEEVAYKLKTMLGFYVFKTESSLMMITPELIQLWRENLEYGSKAIVEQLKKEATVKPAQFSHTDPNKRK